MAHKADSIDFENHVQLKKVFINGWRFPSSLRRIFFIALLLLIPLSSFSKVKIIKYEDRKWKLYVNPDKYLLILGPWGDEPVVLDRSVDDVWGIAAPYGLAVVYKKGIEFRWAMLQGDTGEKIVGGVLLYAGPDTGFVEWLQMSKIIEGATVKVVFDNRKYIVYQLDIHGHKTITREGKLEKP